MKKTFQRQAMALAAAVLALVALNGFAFAAGDAGQAPGKAAPPAAGMAAGHAHGQAAADAGKGCGCECCKDGCKDDCECCKKGCPGGKDCPCAQKHAGKGKHSMKEGMKAHMGDVRKKVDALKDLEKKMEGITDAAEFRKAAMQHFRLSTDLLESHLKHMESMMGGGDRGHGHHGHGCPEPCKDCPQR